jgi:hypothetical protein
MKISELTTEIIADYLRIDTPDSVQAREVEMAKDGAVQFVKDYTAQDDDFINSRDDITLAVLILTADFYENRQFTTAGNRTNNINKAVESILAMHSVALI